MGPRDVVCVHCGTAREGAALEGAERPFGLAKVCGECGYDVSATPGRPCPECGSELRVDPDAFKASTSLRREFLGPGEAEKARRNAAPRKRDDRPAVVCGKCGYDVTKTPGLPCPECGSEKRRATGHGGGESNAAPVNRPVTRGLGAKLRVSSAMNVNPQAAGVVELCSDCGEDVTALPGEACPECGSRARTTPARLAYRERLARRFVLETALTIVLGVLFGVGVTAAVVLKLDLNAVKMGLALLGCGVSVVLAFFTLSPLIGWWQPPGVTLAKAGAVGVGWGGVVIASFHVQLFQAYFWLVTIALGWWVALLLALLVLVRQDFWHALFVALLATGMVLTLMTLRYF